MRLALCVVVLKKPFFAGKCRRGCDGVFLCALVGKRLAAFHRYEEWRAILWRGGRRKAGRYLGNLERRKEREGDGDKQTLAFACAGRTLSAF